MGNILEGATELSDAVLTNRVFHGSFVTVGEGDVYYQEWERSVIAADGTPFTLTYQFPVVKGDEPEAEVLPWDDAQYITTASQILDVTDADIAALTDER